MMNETAATATIVIAGLGARTCVGLSWPATAAAVRAGINAFSLSGHLRAYRDGEPIKLSRLATLPVEAPAFERMKRLAAGAAAEALSGWSQSAAESALPEIPVVLALPAPRPGFTLDDAGRLAQEIIASVPVAVAKKQCRLVCSGAEGGLFGLGAAADLVKSGAPAVLLGGVDSRLQIELLHQLEAQGRLIARQQPNGFIPGEGAGFVLVCSEATAAQRRLPVLATVLAVGRGNEPRLFWGQDPTLGEGLTEAFHAVFKSPGFPTGKVQVTYSDLNGESWRAEEWSYAYVRTGKRHGSPLDHRHPASSWGDVGAATGPLLIGLAALDLARSFDSTATALLWAASDAQPHRSACLLRGPPKG